MRRALSAVLRDCLILAATPSLLVRSLAATRYAVRAGAPGTEFASFGRSLGLRALAARDRSALDFLVIPVSIVRYWEFPFVLRQLPRRPGRCLDISSPRLLSFYVALRMQPTTLRMLNPDGRDAELTRRLATRLGIRGVVVEPQPVSAIEGLDEHYDSIWSVSVVEHIPADGDTEAMRLIDER